MLISKIKTHVSGQECKLLMSHENGGVNLMVIVPEKYHVELTETKLIYSSITIKNKDFDKIVKDFYSKEELKDLLDNY